jgi:cytochrome c oxidase accessory protein FixG
MRRDAGPWNWDKIWRKGATQGMWITVALWTGFTFVGYFTPIHALGSAVLQWTLGPWETFWIFFYGFATYGFAGYMREQVCKYMCPYARFQSAMFDKDTLIVTYDSERGEPRGARSKKADPRALNLGACVDCSLCVQVCPTGIDIRKGLQYECIGCGACADVCDSVMDKVGYPRGLVKYSTQNAVHQHWTRAQTLRHVLRPRVLVYVGILATVLVAMGVSLALRSPFKVDVVRDRGTLARIVAGGKMENVYRLQIMNATELAQEFVVQASGMDGIEASMDQPTLAIGPAQARWVAVRVQIPYETALAGSHPFEFSISAQQSAAKVVEKSVFIVPR